MNALLRARSVALIALALLAVTACGQMGPLTLPQDVSADEDEQGEDGDEQ